MKSTNASSIPSWPALWIAGAVSLFGAWQLAAQAPPAAGTTKVGVIDVQRILTDSSAGKQALERLKKLQDERVAEGKKKQQEINELRNRLSEGRLSLAEDKLTELEKALEDRMIDFRRFQDDADRELQTARNDAFERIEAQVIPIIAQVGEEAGYTVIFNKFQSGLLYARDEIDITDQIIQRFDATPRAAVSPQG